MPSAATDGLNVYSVKSATRSNGCPGVVATGKIRTRSSPGSSGRAARRRHGAPALADPDWPRKVRDGGHVVPCVYNNVCKALDERFHRVRCTLWRKHDLHAPEAPSDTTPPAWPAGARVTASWHRGGVRLEWTAAEDEGGVYGYMILRSEAGGPWVHVDSARGVSHRFDDDSASAQRTATGSSPTISREPVDRSAPSRSPRRRPMAELPRS
jgi:hypothetical protein